MFITNGFKRQIFGIGSNRFANWATITAARNQVLFATNFSTKQVNLLMILT